MRQIVLDTETTGFDPATDRIVEVGAVELYDLLPTGRTYHVYCNPGIPVPLAAQEVHGLTDAFLAQFPPLDPVPLQAFLAGSPIVAHNAGFDMGFLQAAVGTLPNPVVDTLALARRKHPGAPCTLDALCKRYRISTAHRTKHGALLDASLLAEVYIELVGRQSAMDLAIVESASGFATIGARPAPLPARITPAELAAHASMAATISGNLWLPTEA